MLEVFSKYICSIVISILGFLIIREISEEKQSLFCLRTALLIFLLIISQQVVYNVTYSISSTLLIFLVNIIFYKMIFKMNLEKSIMCCGLYMILIIFSDIVYTIIIRNIYTMEEIRTTPIITMLSNTIIGIISLMIIKIKPIQNIFKQFLKLSINKPHILNSIFILLLISAFICLGYNVVPIAKNDVKYIMNFAIMLILSAIFYIFIQDKIKYNQLRDEYDTLFGYVQNFEEWIEKEQLNRHEYKNQLAVLRSLSTNKAVINKINEILDDNMKIKGDVVYKLKELPKGGLKGLMYYKVAVAQKQNVNIEVDVSIKRKSIFKSLNETQIKVLCNLIGIYFDNAIEASLETKKKSVSIEVYEHKEGIKFVISNTYKRSENFDKRNERGMTTKGQGHGNGLYYANNLTSKNKWLEASQEIIDGYYIQNLIIKKLD